MCIEQILHLLINIHFLPEQMEKFARVYQFFVFLRKLAYSSFFSHLFTSSEKPLNTNLASFINLLQSLQRNLRLSVFTYLIFFWNSINIVDIS